MSAIEGGRGEILFGDDGTVSELVSWQLNEKGDQVAVTAMSSVAAARSFMGMLTDWGGDLVVNYDPAGDPALGYLIGEDVDYLGESADILGDGPDHVAVNYPTAVKVFPQGDGTPGLKYWAGDITITSIQRQAAVDGKILVSLSFKGTGALTRETVS